MKNKFCVVVVGVITAWPALAALTPGGACPGVSGWYIYKCDCTNDGHHSGCRSNIASSGQTTCYISSSNGGADDECTWICASAKNADPCTVCKCPQTTDWYDYGDNFVVRDIYNNTTASYSCTYVSDRNEYGCAANYYLSDSDECVACPSVGGIAGRNGIGSTDIATCYIPANQVGNDGTGSFSYTSDCYYRK